MEKQIGRDRVKDSASLMGTSGVIRNPVLPGFHPDPSILRVEDDYYIATSTFEWFPGVQINHSKDLIHWDLVGYPLTRVSQLNMMGEEDSCGVWAPCLSYDKGRFYLIYTDVKSFIGNFKDTHNYLVTAEDIHGPWSEPIYLNSSGFDPSMFHDRDGRKYLVNMVMDHRSYSVSKFAGIVLQEYSEAERKLVGPKKVIFKGSHLGVTEGPHLYWKDGYYYLMTAEGGTGYRHAVTVARSWKIDGPYEVAPNTPMVTSRYFPTHALQKAGHGSLVETPDHQWYLAHLCSRPVGPERRCILGRETSIQKVKWVEDWPMLEDGTCLPQVEVALPISEKQRIESIKNTGSATADNDENGKTERAKVADENVKMWKNMNMPQIYEDFDGDTWSLHLQSLRIPLGDRASLTERPGWLRLYGAESLNSHFTQTLLGCRQQSFYMEAETKVEFQPENFKQMAGLAYYYNTQCYYYLHITWDDQFGRIISIMKNDLGKGSYPIGMGVPIPEEGPVWLKLTTRKETAQFSYSLDGENYIEIGEPLDATILSDDYFDQTGHGMFTGAFVAICCQDTGGEKKFADFDWLCVKNS